MTKHKTSYNEEDDPCFKEREMSHKCLNDNDYNQKACRAYFENYKVCKNFWGKIESKRHASGIFPYMPDLEERKKIKEEMKIGRSAK